MCYVQVESTIESSYFLSYDLGEKIGDWSSNKIKCDHCWQGQYMCPVLMLPCSANVTCVWKVFSEKLYVCRSTSQYPRIIHCSLCSECFFFSACESHTVPSWSVSFSDLYALTCGSGSTKSACNAGDLASIPGSGRSPGEGNGYPLQYSCLENTVDWWGWWAAVYVVTKSWDTTERLTCFNLDFPGDWDSKESACSDRDPDPIPRLGRSSGEGSGYPLQYSYLENPMDRGAWWATVHGAAKSWIWLSS